MNLVFLILFLVILLNLKKKNNFEKFNIENFNSNFNYNVYLIANNNKLEKHYITKINSIKLNKNDKIVRFNHSQNPNIFNNQTDICVFRNNKYHYHGKNTLIWKKTKNKEVILLGKNKNTENTIKFFKNNNNKIRIVNYSKVNGKTESSGKIMINYFLENPNINKIFLVGFNFYEGITNWHNFQNEKDFVKKNSKKIIQL